MPLVATLVSNARDRALDAALGERARAAVGAGTVRWLAPGIACDVIPQAGLDTPAAQARLRDAVAGAPVDVTVQQESTRRKSILIADMDSTMIGQECIDELAAEAGLGSHVAAITARAMAGEIAFEPALRERVGLLKGLPVAIIAKVIAERIAPAPGARELVRTMRAHGAHTALVSGGFTAFTGPVAAMIGFDEHRANTLLETDGALTGTVAEPVLGRDAKAAALAEIAARLGRTPAEAIAVGDGANDLAMLELAGSGVALHAKPAVAATAPYRIDHGDLTALLYMQGYAGRDFVR